MKEKRKAGAPAPRNKVTLAEIAEEAHLSRSGVSRALRNDPSIPPATCKRVQEIAARLGFVSDNRISRAYSLIRMSGQSSFRGNLGFINAYPDRAYSREKPAWYLTSLFKSARERAEEVGYRLDELSISHPRMTTQRITDIIKARGIQGLLIPPLPDALHKLPIAWNDFACVAITHSLIEPVLHRVTPNQYQNMLLALEGLDQRNYKRIGFLIWKEFSKRVNNTYHGAYLYYQYTIDGKNRLPILEPDGEFEDCIDEWMEKHRPDAIVAIHPNLVEMFERRGLLTGDNPLGFVSLGGPYTGSMERLNGKVTYICQKTDDVARSGIDLLVAQIDRRELGVPGVANYVQIMGEWKEGITTPVNRS